MCIPIFAALGTALTGATGTAAAISGTMAAASIGTTVFGAYSQYQQGKANQQAARNNAQMAEYQAQDAIARGEKDVHTIQQRGAAVKAAQRTSMAARGLDLGYGTAQDLQDQTDFFAATDSATARGNAARDAWSLRTRGASYKAEADSINPGLNAGMTLLGGATQVASKWYTPNSVGRQADPIGDFYLRGTRGAGD